MTGDRAHIMISGGIHEDELALGERDDAAADLGRWVGIVREASALHPFLLKAPRRIIPRRGLPGRAAPYQILAVHAAGALDPLVPLGLSQRDEVHRRPLAILTGGAGIFSGVFVFHIIRRQYVVSQGYFM